MTVSGIGKDIKELDHLYIAGAIEDGTTVLENGFYWS